MKNIGSETLNSIKVILYFYICVLKQISRLTNEAISNIKNSIKIGEIRKGTIISETLNSIKVILYFYICVLKQICYLTNEAISNIKNSIKIGEIRKGAVINEIALLLQKIAVSQYIKGSIVILLMPILITSAILIKNAHLHYISMAASLIVLLIIQVFIPISICAANKGGIWLGISAAVSFIIFVIGIVYLVNRQFETGMIICILLLAGIIIDLFALKDAEPFNCILLSSMAIYTGIWM